jgi:presenilin-like A22 family membrane protease
MSKINYSLIFSELSLFLSIQVLGLVVGWKYFALKIIEPLPVEQSIPTFLITFLVATGFLLILIKYLKGALFFQIMFSLLILIGADITLGAFIVEPIAIILAAVILVSRIVKPSILTHNFAMFLAIAGVGAQLGLILTIPAVIILLILLSIYDVYAVFKSKHMIKLFKGMMEKGAAMAIVIPHDIRDLKAQMQTVKKEKMKKYQPDKRKFFMLGTGDVAFPIVFSVAALQTSLLSSIAVIIGSLFGILMIHYIISRKKYEALPALPPIALTTILAYAASLLFI